MCSESTFLNITRKKSTDMSSQTMIKDKKEEFGRLFCVCMHEHFAQFNNITAKLHIVFLYSLLIISSSLLSGF